MALVFLLSLLAVPAFAVDFVYNYWLTPTGYNCDYSVCPITPTHNGFFGTCYNFTGTGFNLGANFDNTGQPPADFNLSFYGGSSTSGGCAGLWTGSIIVTCLTCEPGYRIGENPTFRDVCFQIVNQSSCVWGLERPTRSPSGSPPSPNPPSPKGHYLEEHYEKSSSTEKYDRIENGGSKGGSPSAVSEEALWSSRLPQHLRNYFATSQAAAIPQPTTTTISPLVYFIMALTFGVVIGVGSYMAKRVQKRSEYMPIKESADKDSLLFS